VLRMNPKDAHAQIAGRLQLTPPVRIAPVSIPSRRSGHCRAAIGPK